MAPTTRTVPPKKRTAKKTPPAVAASDGGTEPLRLTSKPTSAEDRVVLFYVDDTAYSIPKVIGRNHGLRFLKTARRQGEAMAAQELMEILLGEDGYDALMSCDGLSDEDLDVITTRLRDGALGEVEDETGGKGR
jgi:hypothetical protein